MAVQQFYCNLTLQYGGAAVVLQYNSTVRRYSFCSLSCIYEHCYTHYESDFKYYQITNTTAQSGLLPHTQLIANLKPPALAL